MLLFKFCRQKGSKACAKSNKIVENYFLLRHFGTYIKSFFYLCSKIDINNSVCL